MVKKSRLTRKRLLPSQKSWRPWVVVAALLVGGGYLLVYRPIVVRLDKQRFDKAEASIEQLYLAIEAEVGKPDEVKREKSCGRANLKNDRGPLTCDVGIYWIYDTQNNVEASNLVKKIDPVASRETSFVFNQALSVPITGFQPSDPNLPSQETYRRYTEIDSKINCSISYFFNIKTKNYGDLVVISSQNLVITLDCGSIAKGQHYTLRN